MLPLLCLHQIDWVAVSSVATAIMAFFTFLTLIINGFQLYNMRKQWKEEARPLLDIQMIHTPNEKYPTSVSIKIRNIGKSIARDVKINVKFERPDEVKVGSLIRGCEILSSSKLRIVPGESAILDLCIIEDFEPIRNERRYRVFDDIIDQDLFNHIIELLHYNKTIVDCTYNGKYKEHEELSMRDLGYAYHTTEKNLPNIS